MGSVCDGLVKLDVLGGAEFAQGLALQFEPMSAVHQTVEHGIGDCGIADVSVPVVDRQLAGDDGGSAAVTIVDDFQL